MSVLTCVPNPNLSAELSKFIYSVSRRNFTNAPELTRVGVSLLRKFPASRSAVLDYFACVFQDAISVAVQQDFDNEAPSSPSLEAVSLIVPEICGLEEEWASVITPWCIDMLKDTATSKSNYNASVMQNCEPVRGLLDMVTTNLTRLVGDERAKCIDMLLESRDCDWAVTYVARCDPSLVIPRALRPGLDSERLLHNLEGIMNNLPANRAPHITSALMHLFNEAVSPDGQLDKKNNIVLHLLNLAVKSDTVLKALLTDSVMERLISPDGGAACEGVSPTLLVTLLMRSDVATPRRLLACSKNPYWRRRLEHLLQELEREVISGSKPPLLASIAEDIASVRLSLLHGDKLERYTLARMLILVCHLQPSELVNTLSFLLQYSRNDSSLALLVRIAAGAMALHTPDDSENFVDTERYQNLINTAVENAFREAAIADGEVKKSFIDGATEKVELKTYVHHLCLNLTTLLRWENSNKVSHLRNLPISKACEANLYRIACAFEESVSLVRTSKECTMSSLDPRATYQAIAGLLDHINMSGARSPPPSVDAILKLTKATVQYFFRCLHEPDELQKMRGAALACRLLRRLCVPSKISRSVALRALLETAMFREDDLFGPNAPGEIKSRLAETYLIHLNRKHGPMTQLTQSHTSVFHAGIIGRGARKPQGGTVESLPTPLTTEIELLNGALMSCMEGNGGSVEGMTTVSLLLVELVSPDVMYNGLPWPDEDFTKVSIERELYIRGALEGCYVARAALRRAAASRPALCYASALLRAVAATLLHQYRATDDRYVGRTEIQRLYGVTAELIETMVLGQLLPHPLNYMLEMYRHLKPHEIVQVLRDCIWNYTRDNVPSPALFKCDTQGVHWREPSTCKPPPAYTDTLRLIIQKNIARLGHLYPLMFMQLEAQSG